MGSIFLNAIVADFSRIAYKLVFVAFLYNVNPFFCYLLCGLRAINFVAEIIVEHQLNKQRKELVSLFDRKESDKE